MNNELAIGQLSQIKSVLSTLCGPHGIDALDDNEVVDVVTIAVGLLTSTMTALTTTQG